MDVNLVIDDIYVQTIGRRSKVRGEKLEAILDKYIAIIGEIETEAITNGEISKAITEYKECVLLLNDKLSEISKNIDTVSYSFIIDINDADAYLF